MPLIRFVSADGALLAAVAAEAGENLLDLARRHEIPLQWRCGQGTCGSCRIHLQHSAQPCRVELSRKERHVLLRAGLIGTTEADSASVVDQHSAWRLACHCVLGAQDWTVVVPAADY